MGWIDLFIRTEYKEIIVQSLQHCIERKGLEVYAWCIMTSHVHLIIGTTGKPMEDIMRDHKSHTSEMLRTEIQKHPQESRREWMMRLFIEAGKQNPNNRGFQLWQQHNHPVGLSSAEMLYQRLEYIHENPVVAGFVSAAQDWMYSSARDYYTENRGLLKGIKILEPDTNVR